MKRFVHLSSIAPCLLPIIIDSLGFGLVYPILTAIFNSPIGAQLVGSTSEQLNAFYLGLAYMLFPFCMLFGASFFGDLSDNLGRKKVIGLCMTGMVVSFLLMALGISILSLSLFLIGRGLTGLMAGSQPIAQAAIADLSTPKNKAFNMSIMTFTIALGIVIGPLIGGFFSDPNVIEGFGFWTPFVVAALLSLIAFIWILFGFKETFEVKEKKKLHPLRPILIFKEGFAKKTVRYLILLFSCNQVGFGIFFQTILIQINQDFQYSRFLLGVFNGWIGLGFAIGLILLIPYSLKRWKVETVGVLSLVATGIFEVLSGVNDNAPLTWALALPVAMADIVAYTMIMTVFSNAADKSSQGWIMGIFGAVVAISFALAGFSTNLLGLTGTHGLIVIGGVLQLLSGFLLWHFIRKHPDYAAHGESEASALE
ncbi:MFS transporter [Simkania sp.]|uniref:MFS transporter n=1 Tax=Simkania sp. TaxID=34094 RepID=UPI003B523D07